MPAPGDLKDVLAQLRERYLASSSNTIAAFAQLAEQLHASPAAVEVVETLRRELHRVHGTAGSYGFHEASRLAGALEPVAIKWAADPELDRSRRAPIVRQFVRALSGALRPPSVDEPVISLQRLLMVEVPEEASTGIVSEAIHRGYHVETATEQTVVAVLNATPPTVVIAGAHLAIAMPEGVPLIQLRAPHGDVARNAGARVLDSGTDPREILLMAESLATRTGLVGLTLLVVEDDPAMSELLRSLGERQGMFVETRSDASDIEATIDAVNPVLLLLDIGLPGVNGLVVTRRLRNETRYEDLPIVLVSASTDVDTRTAAFVAGADDFQSKPIVAEELLRRISRLLDLGRQRQLARGVHPGTGILLPDRALRVFDERLAAAAAIAEPISLAIVRPIEPPDGTQRAALWHRELRRVSQALVADGVVTGFRDEYSVMLLVPGDAERVMGRLSEFAAESGGDVVAWRAGLAELRPGADPSAARLARLAEEAWLTARDGAELVHRWNERDAGIAPDVIVVEDDEALADLITFALGARGLTWVVYTTGPDALEGLRAMRVHGRSPILLLDVDLPGLDGFSLYERVRVERAGVFRAVFISVHASESDQLRALRAGALDYIGKPLSLRVLMAKIVSWRASGPGA